MAEDLVSSVMVDLETIASPETSPSALYLTAVRILERVRGWDAGRVAPVRATVVRTPVQKSGLEFVPSPEEGVSAVAPNGSEWLREQAAKQVEGKASPALADLLERVEAVDAPAVDAEPDSPAVDAPVEWGLPENKRKSGSSEDADFAASLRESPGVWVEIEVEEGASAGRRKWIIDKINARGAAFRPVGSFQAEQRGSRIFARAVDGPESLVGFRTQPEYGLPPAFSGAPKFDLKAQLGRPQRLAAFIHERPGKWVELIGGAATAPLNVAQGVREGWFAPMRPKEKYEGVTRKGRAFVRFVGPV